MDIIQEAKAISAEFKEIEAEYNSPDSLIDTGNWYYISKKQDEVMSRLVDGLEWRPIDKDTPHDGTMLLLADNRPIHPEDKWVVAGSYEKASKKTGVKRAGWYNQFITGEGEEIYPTHWMPLPLPPTGDK